MRDTWKKNRKKKKEKNTTNAKIEGHLKNSEAFFLQKMKQQSRGDNRSSLFKKQFYWLRFAQEHNFFEGDFFRKEIFKWKEKQERNDKNKLLLKKLERQIFSKHAKITRKWDVEKFCVAEAIFVDNILRSSKDSDLSLKKEVQKKEEKRW